MSLFFKKTERSKDTSLCRFPRTISWEKRQLLVTPLKSCTVPFEHTCKFFYFGPLNKKMARENTLD